MSDSPTPWAPGRQVGRYVLVAPLAAGGMAEIWLARQPGVHGFEKLVCVKRMIGALQDDPDHVQMFLSEARLAAGLSHRHIVQVYELGEEDGSLYIAMEFIEGESLSRVRKRARELGEMVPLDIAVQLVAWAAEGLHYAHTITAADGTPRGIVHRDVSPQNLLVTADGSIKVVDFGIAKVAADETNSGKLKGKLTYMPPEQARAESLDARADVFALGVVLFELVTGTRLFGKAEEIEVLQRLITDQPLPRIRERRPELPKALDDLIAKCLAPVRTDRLESAHALQLALEQFLASHGRRVGTADVTAYLNRLFPGRAAERQALLLAAKEGADISVQKATSLITAHTPGASDGSGSHSGSFSKVATTADPFQAPKANRALLPVALGVGFLVLGSAGAWVVLKKPSAPPPPVVVAPTSGSAAIDCTPKATVVLDGLVLGVTPHLAADLAAGEHRLQLKAPGYVTQERTFTVSAGEKVQLVLALQPEAPSVPEVDAGVAAPTPKDPVAVARATGKLNLRTTPWTTVYLGKRKLGDTPLVGVSLPAGDHVLRVVNAEAGVQSSIEVTIQANKTVNENLVLK